MRYYMRFLLVGAVSGFFCVFNYARNGAGRTLDDIVMLFGFSAVKCQINFVMSAIYWYMPLFLFTAVAAINIPSVLSSSDMGFLIVEGIVFFCIASFCVTGELFVSGEVQREILLWYGWTLLGNPFSHLVLYLHEGRMPAVDDTTAVAGLFLEMWMSIAVFLAAGILVLLWGCHTVKNYELVSLDRGAEGGY